MKKMLTGLHVGLFSAWAMGSPGAVAQPAVQTLKQKLVGSWTFVVTEATQSDGSKLLPFGPHPLGLSIFTEDGHFIQTQVDSAVAKFAANSRIGGTPEENKAAVHGSLAISGTYTVDETTQTLLTKVESSTYPNWVGLEQKRKIEVLTADEFKNSNQAGSIQGATTVNSWKRAKVGAK
jgi:hypothetical protein